MPTAKQRLLILGGTGEALVLARAAGARLGGRLEIVTSLAGRTRAPISPPGEVRIGGFGGRDGLAAYLKDARIDILVDATHPFATVISTHAAGAADACGIPRLALLRPPWRREPGDRWIEVEDAAAAAQAVPNHGRRAFLTLGPRAIPPFAALRDTWFLVRFVDQPNEPLPLADYQLILARGPFSEADELALLREHAIDVVVSRASGGPSTRGKLDAARALRIPVVMIRRPPPPRAPHAASPTEALAWIESRLV